MLIGLNYTDQQYSCSWYGELYTLRFYDREPPRAMTWKNLSDGNFCTSGNWTISGAGGQNIPRYSDRVVLPDGDYAVTLDEDWAVGELSVGAGAALKFDLPSDATATNVVRLTVSGKVGADAAAELALDAAAFGRAYKEGSITLMSCEVASPGALQTLADNVSFVGAGGRKLGRVDVAAGGTALVYTAIPSGTMMIFR